MSFKSCRGNVGMCLLGEKPLEIFGYYVILTGIVRMKCFVYLLSWYCRYVFLVPGGLRIVTRQCNIVG